MAGALASAMPAIGVSWVVTHVISAMVSCVRVREQLAVAMHRAGALRALMQLRRMSPGPPSVCILTYHHLAAHDPACPYDRGVADASPEQFRRQLELVARHATPIGMDQLVGALDGRPLPANPVMVTFDDGYRSCHDLALPILRQLGIPATFFVPSGYIGERKLFWWERIAWTLSRARRTQVTLAYPHRLELEPRSPSARRTLTQIVKDTPGLDVSRFLDELTRACEVEWSVAIEAAHAERMLMSWDHVRALARAGMDVESHSRWHRVLQTLTARELADELAGSKVELEAQLGRPVRAIAYPVGRRVAHVARIREAVKAAGYRVGLTNSSGATRMWPLPLAHVMRADRYDVGRLSVDRDISDALFLTQIAVPQLAYIGKHA